MGLSRAEIEEKIRQKLSKKFEKPLEKHKRLTIGRKLNGKPFEHEFDFVSTDKEVIGEIKSSKLGNKSTLNKGYTSTTKWRLLADCFFLEKACVFQCKVDSDSDANWTLIPVQTGHPFRSKLDRDSQ